MNRIGGQKVYTTFAEIVDPGHTAIIVVDVQNDFVKPEGRLEKSGADLSGRAYSADLVRDMLPRLRVLLAEARNRGVLVVYLRSTQLSGHRSESSPLLYFRYVKWGVRAEDERVVQGTWGHEVVEEIAPEEGDIVVDKHRASGFIGTPLDMILQANAIESVIVTGLATEGCVMATSLVGWYLDYYVVLASDCVGTSNADRNASALEVMSYALSVAPSSEIVEAWSESAPSHPLARTATRQ